MEKTIDFKQDKFAVIGLGETGLSIINYLKYKNTNIAKVFDTRDNPPHQDIIADLPKCFGKLSYNEFLDIDVIVISPGVSIYEPALQEAIRNNKIVVGDIELFAQATKNWNTKIIGITGSNGKTTVTALTGYLGEIAGFKTLVAGNIGKPVLDSYVEIEQSKAYPELIVLELSSFQLESIYSLHLNSATTLNISEDHLDRYRDLLEYAYVKSNIFNNCDVAILNKDDVLVKAMARDKKAKKWFSLNDNASDFTLSHNDKKIYLKVNQQNLLDCSELNLVGMHNYLNCLASLALLDAIGIDIKSSKIINGLKSFKGLEHRMQKVTTKNDITYIEDSKGTNVGAVVAGVSGLTMPVNLILGGDGKGQNFLPLRDLVQKKCRSVAIIGQDKALIENVLNGLIIPIQSFSSLQEAVKFCIDNAQEGDSVVLSPACASWDMFDNYKHRAQVFIDSIYEYI